VRNAEAFGSRAARFAGGRAWRRGDFASFPTAPNWLRLYRGRAAPTGLRFGFWLRCREAICYGTGYLAGGPVGTAASHAARSVWLKAIGHFAPEILAACRKAVDAAHDDGDFVRLDAAAFRRIPADSIDYAGDGKLPAAKELGHSSRVIPLDVVLSDVGAWDALWQAIDRDADDNAVKSDVWLRIPTAIW